MNDFSSVEYFEWATIFIIQSRINSNYERKEEENNSSNYN